MLTIMMLTIIAMIALVITPIFASLNHPEVHHTDLMAGDEG